MFANVNKSKMVLHLSHIAGPFFPFGISSKYWFSSEFKQKGI